MYHCSFVYHWGKELSNRNRDILTETSDTEIKNNNIFGLSTRFKIKMEPRAQKEADEDIPRDKRLSFPTKLLSMLNETEYEPYISWFDEGSAFVVRDEEGFTDNVMPVYFEHSNWQVNETQSLVPSLISHMPIPFSVVSHLLMDVSSARKGICAKPQRLQFPQSGR
jgi:hypothetical protein